MVGWHTSPTPDFERQFRWYEKKRPCELKAVMRNLDTYFKALQAGVKPMQIKYSFARSEPHDVVRISQKGGGGNLAETRLYTYTDVSAKVLHLLTIGDKASQSSDIQMCKRFVAQLRETSDGPTTHHGN